MDPNNPFFSQVQLVVTLLPLVAEHACFALKGGTALNLFVRDLPRLSVDIDLTYLPVQDRSASLSGIDGALHALGETIESKVPRSRVRPAYLQGTGKRFKLVVWQDDMAVKIEVNPVLRGSVYASQARGIVDKVRAQFGYAQLLVLSFEDLYAGKLCAALDRQRRKRGQFSHYCIPQDEVRSASWPGPRIEFAGALYHVTSRGDRRAPIFEDDDDRSKFLGVVAAVVDRFNWVCHAHGLMTNHVPRGSGDTRRQPLPRHAPTRWYVHPSLQPTTPAHRPSVPRAI
jgi:hypothetical protein